MDGYEVKVYYSPDGECCVAQIVEFVGCAVDGPTPEIALARLHEAKADWIRIVREKEHPVPAPCTGGRSQKAPLLRKSYDMDREFKFKDGNTIVVDSDGEKIATRLKAPNVQRESVAV